MTETANETNEKHVHVWTESAVYCSDCGDHPAVRCDADDCDEVVDLVMSDDPRDDEQVKAFNEMVELQEEMGLLMIDITSMVEEFHRKNGLPRCDPFGASQLPAARQSYLQSEVDELQNAKDIVEVADALADIVYVAYGTALTYGINLDDVIEEVHRSNMTKSPPLTPGGKAVKGDDYEPPNIRSVINVKLYDE